MKTRLTPVVVVFLLLMLVGTAAAQYNEAPMLKERVLAGELPPVEERLPKQPLVVEPFEEIGVYGGVLRAGAFGPTSGGLDTEGVRLQCIGQIEPDLATITPNIVRDWDIAEDFTSITLYLREGMKWSDGHPFTADDWMFWYESIALNEQLNPVKMQAWLVDGQMFKMTKIDDHTIRLDFAAPYPSIDIVLAKSHWNGQFFAPKHYLSQFHIDYNDKAEELAKEAGYSTWWEAFQFYSAFDQTQLNPDLPGITPWVLKSIDTFGNKYFERNPYYWKVDTAGNQLPYVDGQLRELVSDGEVRILKFIAGELHSAGENPLPVADYTLYKENEAAGNYRTMLFDNTRGSDASVVFNLTVQNPALRELFNNVEFRKAMSLGIDRQEINDILYFGQAKALQATAPPMTSFIEEWMTTYFAEFDPDKANAMLDEIGLTWHSSGNYRLLPNGERLRITIEATEEFAAVAEMVAEHWTNYLGVTANLQVVERTFFYERALSNDRECAVWTFDGASEFMMRENGGRLLPTWGEPLGVAPLWQTWFDTNGSSGEQPPQEVIDQYNAVQKFLYTTPGTDEYFALGREILTRHGENVWAIGTTVAPRVILMSNKLGNTPNEGTFAWDFGFWSPYKGDQWFFKQ